MLANALKPLTPYLITQGTDSGLFQPGDLIWLSPNGTLNLAHGNGFLLPGEWEQENFTVEETTDFRIIKTNRSERIEKI